MSDDAQATSKTTAATTTTRGFISPPATTAEELRVLLAVPNDHSSSPPSAATCCTEVSAGNSLKRHRGTPSSGDTVVNSSGRFARLPDYMIMDILQALVNDPRDVARFGATCHRMRALVFSSQQWWDNADPGAMPVDRLREIVQQAGGSRLLSLAGTLRLPFKALTDDQALQLVQAIPNLHNLKTRSDLGDRFWTQAIHTISESLVSLSVHDMGGDLLSVVLQSCRKLRSLEVVKSEGTPVADLLGWIPKSVEQLKLSMLRLSPSDMQDVSAMESITDLALQHKQLGYQVRLWDVEVVPHCFPNLVSLHLGQACCSGLRCLTALKHLRAIHIAIESNTDEHYERAPFSPCLGVTADEYGRMRGSERNLAWHGAIAVELQILAEAPDCAPFEQVGVVGERGSHQRNAACCCARIDLTGFFAGRRCGGLLRDLTLGCWVPGRCAVVIADSCGGSLRRLSCRGAFVEPLKGALLRGDPSSLPTLQTLSLVDFTPRLLAEVVGLLGASTSVVCLEIETGSLRSLRDVAAALGSARGVHQAHVLAGPAGFPRLQHLALLAGDHGLPADLGWLSAVARNHQHLAKIDFLGPQTVPRPGDLQARVAFAWRSYCPWM